MMFVRRSVKTLRVGFHLAIGGLATLALGGNPDIKAPGHLHTRVISWWHRKLCRILNIDIEITGQPLRAGALLVANHVSWLDIPVVASICPTGFLSKSEIRGWPLVGWMAASAGTLFISRGSHRTAHVRQELSQRLEDGRLMTLFPEGTTTDGRDVRPFFPRLLAVAVERDYPVQPVAVRYFRDGKLDSIAPFVGEESFPHHLRRLMSEDVISVEIVFCPPIAPPHADRRHLAEQARTAILTALPAEPRATQIPCDEDSAGLVNQGA